MTCRPSPRRDEPDRRHVVCGAVAVKASGLRIFENFLDMAHFPFVHTDMLGAEPNTEVLHYTAEIRRDVDEVWATDCQFFQPEAAVSARGGIMTSYQYRVASPFVTVLHKTCPNAAGRWDVIALFVQPRDPGRCRAHPVMSLIDDQSPMSTLAQFQQLIFLQDRVILENQRPAQRLSGGRRRSPPVADPPPACVPWPGFSRLVGSQHGVPGAMAHRATRAARDGPPSSERLAQGTRSAVVFVRRSGHPLPGEQGTSGIPRSG